MTATIVFLLAAAAPAPNGRAVAAQRPVTFSEARAAAARRAPEVVIALEREEIARAQIDVAGAMANPTVTLQTARQTARLGAGFSLPLPVFGQRTKAVNAAEADAEATRLETAVVRHDALWSGTVAWVDLWEAEERARLLTVAATDADRVATIAEQRFQAGSTARVDALRTRADRERARAEATAAGLDVSAAAARLALWIPAPEGGELRAAGPPGFTSLGDYASLAARLGDHPVTRRDLGQAAAALARVRAEQRFRWPIVSAEAGVNLGDPTLPGTDVLFGLAFEAPILSLRRGAIARARSEQALAETIAALDTSRLGAQFADAYRRAESAGARARALGEQVLPALEEVRRMTEEGYRDGRVDLLRLLDATRALVDSRLAAVQAQAAWQRALADVERAAGITLDGMAIDAP